MNVVDDTGNDDDDDDDDDDDGDDDDGDDAQLCDALRSALSARSLFASSCSRRCSASARV